MGDECGWRGWRAAAQWALYGSDGFFHRPEGPAGHFRTSVHASPLFAGAVVELLRRLDGALERPDELALVDMGAGRGELLAGVLAALEGTASWGGAGDMLRRLRPYAVERAVRPEGLDDRIVWRDEPPAGVRGLLFANEWLDNVPVDVVEVDAAGVVRQVLVTVDGSERLGAPVERADADWLDRWWPLAAVDGGPGAGPVPGTRAEIGRPRDAAWAAAVATVGCGLAVAVDYAHRRGGRPPFGTLTGFREGREVRPVPDGSCDLTAHVALDSCAPAGRGARPEPALLTQRAALRALGVCGRRPPLELASRDPVGYVRALSTAGEAAELTDPGGLGGFGWLVQPVPGESAARERLTPLVTGLSLEGVGR